MNGTMHLVAIDTCGALGSVALVRLDGDDLTVLTETELAGKTYSARLIPAIRAMLSEHVVGVASLSGIVVTSGPGSFTGIRIGLSTAKGLAEAHSIPLLAVSRLAVLAHCAQSQAAALDAHRGEIYFGSYTGSPGERLVGGEDFGREAAALERPLAVCEEAVHLLAPMATLVPAPTAADAARFALPRLRAGEYDDPLLLDGNYLRRSDAEIFSAPKPGAVPVV